MIEKKIVNTLLQVTRYRTKYKNKYLKKNVIYIAQKQVEKIF